MDGRGLYSDGRRRERIFKLSGYDAMTTSAAHHSESELVIKFLEVSLG